MVFMRVEMALVIAVNVGNGAAVLGAQAVFERIQAGEREVFLLGGGAACCCLLASSKMLAGCPRAANEMFPSKLPLGSSRLPAVASDLAGSPLAGSRQGSAAVPHPMNGLCGADGLSIVKISNGVQQLISNGFMVTVWQSPAAASTYSHAWQYSTAV